MTSDHGQCICILYKLENVADECMSQNTAIQHGVLSVCKEYDIIQHSTIMTPTPAIPCIKCCIYGHAVCENTYSL